MQTINSFKPVPKAILNDTSAKPATKTADYRLNIIPFDPIPTAITVDFTTKWHRDWHRFSLDKLPESAKASFTDITAEQPYVYTCFENNPDNTVVQLCLNEHPAIARAYYTKIIRDYLKTKADAVTTNFLYDTEFWFNTGSNSFKDYDAFKKFTIRVIMDSKSGQAALLVSYDGLTYVLKKSVKALTSEGSLDPTLITQVVFRKQLYYKDSVPEAGRYHPDEQFPLLNPELSKVLNIKKPVVNLKTRCTHYISEIEQFAGQYLFTDDFKNIIPHRGIWKQVEHEMHSIISPAGNELLFGGGNTGNDAYKSIKNYGPCELPGHKNFKLFLIYENNDGDNAILLHSYLYGKSGFLNLSEFTRIPIHYEHPLNIKFDVSKNIIEQIQEKINLMNINPECYYYAFYISPFTKYEPSQEKRDVYFKVKELLMRRGIGLQVIERQKINQPGFQYFMANIGVAMIAKAGGIPYKLNKTDENELIVGFGAFKPQKKGIRYVGSSFCFSTDGTFKEFDCFPATDTWAIAGSIESAIYRYRAQHKDLKRIIIHFYKSMNQKELQPIEKILHKLNHDIPVIILTINKTASKDFLAFDCLHDCKTPYNGTFINLGHRKFLFFINDRHDPLSKVSVLPLPLKIRISASNATVFDDEKLTHNLLQQVYDFCFMYWRSVKASHLPVTIAYPEMVAQAFPYFESMVIPDYGRRSLWMI